MISNFYLKRENKGFLVLTMVLLVNAVVLALATGIFFRSISQMTETIDSENSLKAWCTVNACGEYALGKITTTAGGQPGWGYLGDESLTVGTETCYIYPIEANGTGKSVKASSTVSNFTKKILIEVATSTTGLVVSSWREVADF